MNKKKPDRPASLQATPTVYADWLGEVKRHIHDAQQRAALAVNREMVLLYWQLGGDILDLQGRQGWGCKMNGRLAHDLRMAFPDMMVRQLPEQLQTDLPSIEEIERELESINEEWEA